MIDRLDTDAIRLDIEHLSHYGWSDEALRYKRLLELVEMQEKSILRHVKHIGEMTTREQELINDNKELQEMVLQLKESLRIAELREGQLQFKVNYFRGNE
jgi:hypothetical protein